MSFLACTYHLVPITGTLDNVTSNLAARVMAGRLYMYHNQSYHIGVLHQEGMRVDAIDCAVVGLGMVRGDERTAVRISGLELDRLNGWLQVRGATAC